MAAIGSVWRSTTWSTVPWAANTWKGASAPIVSEIPPSPTRLANDLVTTELATDFAPTLLAHDPVNTGLAAFDAEGFEMATPLTFTQGETGAITFRLTGADGTPENLTTASSVTLRITDYAGNPIVNAVALTSLTSDGTGVWTRTGPQVATPGDYRMQITVVRADGTTGRYPDGQFGSPLTILPAV